MGLGALLLLSGPLILLLGALVLPEGPLQCLDEPEEAAHAVPILAPLPRSVQAQSCDSRRSVTVPGFTLPGTRYPPRMIRVYSTPDGRARAIAFDDHAPTPPLELVQAFPEHEREAAWALLHTLGGEPSAA